MVSVFAYIMIDRGFDPGSCQIKDYDIGSCCFSARNAASDGVRVNTGWLGVRIKCPSGETRVPVDCCFSEIRLV